MPRSSKKGKKGKKNDPMKGALGGIAAIVAVCAVLICFSPVEDALFHLPDLFVPDNETNINRITLPCEKDGYKDQVEGCTPDQCGRVVMDNVITEEQADDLRELAEFGLKYGGGSGGPSVLDLTTGAMSHQEQFVDVYKVLDHFGESFPEEQLETYKAVVEQIRQTVMKEFNKETLYPTTPTFFNRIEAGKDPRTQNDQYWHEHVDTITYPSFSYTGLLYLNDHVEDFEGGEFIFTKKRGGMAPGSSPPNSGDSIDESAVLPKKGRLLLFTSAAENSHYIKRVRAGTRWVVTMSFTCDEEKAVDFDEVFARNAATEEDSEEDVEEGDVVEENLDGDVVDEGVEVDA